MNADEEFGADFDAEVDDVSMFFTEEEIVAGSGKTNPFATAQIDHAAKRLELAKVLPKFAEWDEADRAYRGGRKPVLDDRAIMIAIFLLRAEGTPLHITQIANVFRYRLTRGAVERFGLPRQFWSSTIEKDIRNWYNRSARSLHRIVDRMDAWPARRGRHTRLQRIELANQRSTLASQNLRRLKQERMDWFSNAMLEMTFQAQPARLREKWRGGLTVDQTAVRTLSQSGPRQKDSDGAEIPKLNSAGVEIERWVTEVDAAWYPRKAPPSANHQPPKSPTAKTKKTDGTKTQEGFTFPYELAYMANITIMTKTVSGKNKPAEHPILALGLSVAPPNKDVAGQTVRAVQSIADRGHNVHHLTFDRGYRGVDKLLKPLRELGVPVVMDFKKDQVGINGGSGGAIHVEGKHYCPATPERLLEATRNFREDEIDWDIWQNYLKERVAYEAHQLEKPDEKERVPVSCPALGPSATVNCPIREEHPGRSKKWKSRPKVLKANIPKALPKICTAKKSVSINLLDTIEHQQMLRYGSEEWDNLYTAERNLMESWNGILTNGPERLSHPADRRIRGLAAQQFIITMLVVSANLRRIATFLQEERFETPKKVYPRGRDIRGESTYANAKRRPRKSANEIETPSRT